MAPHLKRFTSSEVAQERLRILNYYKKYGEKATRDAFGVDRKLVYIWRKRMRKVNHVSSLVPYSKRPIHTRRKLTHPKVVEYIVQLRSEHFRLGKDKTKPLLDEYCLKENLPTVSISTIGRIIKDRKLFYQKEGGVYHNPNANYKKRYVKRERVRYAPKPADLGHIQIDTILRIEDGIKYYLYSSVDVKGKFALSLPYKRATSENTVDYFRKLEYILPYKIKSVQTDNGHEFLGVFESHLKKMNINHLFIYPRCPRINGVVERFNRTIQEECINPNIHLIHDQEEFQRKLAEYVIFYNCQRVHKSLNYMTPIDYILQKGGMSNMCRTYTRSQTNFINVI